MGFVYFMKNGVENVVKIGRARDVESRRGQFMTGNPQSLTVIEIIETDDAGPLEAVLHRMFQSKRLRGEFFTFTRSETETAVAAARQWVAELPIEREASRLSVVASDRPPRLPNDHERALHRELLEAREEKCRADLKCARLENQLKVATGTAAGLVGILSWTTYTRNKFSESNFKKAHPKLHAEFSQLMRQRTFRLLWR